MRSSLSLSLAFHALILILLLMFGEQARRGVSRPTDWIEIETPPLAKNEAKKKKPDEPRQQIVQTDHGQTVKDAPDKAFLGERNQEVDRQTVSRDHRITMGKPDEKTARPEEAQNEQKEAHQREARQNTEAKNQTNSQAEPTKPPEDLKLSKLGAPILPTARFGASGGPKEWEDSHNWAEFGSRPEDYVPGLKEGDRTALNTKEYVFYGYFQRIRERLDRAWVPILRDRLVKMYRMGRTLASDMDHTTQVMVILNPQGEIVRVKVVSESGTRDLDDAAVRAFNQAGPFPNPPHGIVDPNGEIQIPWQFILKT